MEEQLSTFTKYLEKYGQQLIDYIPTLITAVVIFIFGLWIIKIINKLVRKFFLHRDYDVTLEKFVASMIRWGLRIVLFVVVVNQLGVESASLIAVIGSAGLAIGLALQGSLSNLAGGVLILLLRPFKVGDWIKAQGVEGSVKEISIFTTKLLTFGNQLAVIPNGKLSNDIIVNFTEEGIRREALTFGVAYDSDLKQAKEILMNMVMELDAVFKNEEQAPMVLVTDLGDSAVSIALRYWTTNDDFWNTRFYVIEEGKKRLEAAGIKIPYPQRELTIIKEI